MRKFQYRLVRIWLSLVVAATVCGCETTPRTPPPAPMQSVMRMTNHVGGSHYRTIVHNNLWYQTFSNELLVIDPGTLQPVTTLELATFGECGPAVDMTLANGDLYVLLEHDEILQISIDDPARPRIVDQRTAAQLRLLPEHLSVVSVDGRDVVYVCGDAGATLFRGGPVCLAEHGRVTSVAMSDSGPVGTVGRRVFRLDDGGYVGAASALQAIPGDPDNGLLFVQRGDNGALVGIMESSIRERNARTFTTAVGGTVHRVRWFDNSIWIVADEQILSYRLADAGLELRDVFRVRGARDVDFIRENYLAVAGTFGRAVYRIRADSNGAGDTFVLAHREPGLLLHAISDRLQVLAGAPDQGTWLYQVGSDARLLDRELTQHPPIAVEAVIDDGVAAISDDGSSLSVRTDGTVLTWRQRNGHTLRCVIAVEGRLWVGHDRGLTILEVAQPSPEDVAVAAKKELPPPEPRLVECGAVWLHGPVHYLFALLTGRGAAYVAQHGGFGTVEMIEEPVPVSDRPAE